MGDEFDAWRQWSTDKSLSTNDQGDVVGLGNKEGVAQLLLGLKRDAVPRDFRRKLAALLEADQRADGSWNPGGQLPTQKRPASETASVSTMWLTLALLDAESFGKPEPPTIERATRHIRESQPGESTEWYAVRLLPRREAWR